MGDIGTPMSETIPAVGASGTTYAEDINDFLTEVQDRLEAEVPKSSLADGALDMNGSAVQNASYLGLTTQVGAPSTPNLSLQAFGGNLYWINPGGAVQITSGTSLNTSLLGGITGDYGGVNPAQFRFVDADQEYYAYDNYAGGAWARVWARNFDIPSGPTAATRVRLAYATAASYTLTLPATPASDALLQMDSSGTVTASNTLDNDLTITGEFSAEEIKFTSLHSKYISSSAFNSNHDALGNSVALFDGTVWGWPAGGVISCSLTVDEGDLIDRIDVYIRKNSDATNTITADFYSRDPSTGASTLISSANNAANNPGNVTISLTSLATTVAANTLYFLRVSPSDATPSSPNDALWGCKLTYSRP